MKQIPNCSIEFFAVNKIKTESSFNFESYYKGFWIISSCSLDADFTAAGTKWSFLTRLPLFRSYSQASERERLQEELEEAKDKARRRSIGNIKFIGELFKLRMLTEAIMHDCVVKLLKNHDEESLECLCRLLTTIGKDLDFEKAKVSGLS